MEAKKTFVESKKKGHFGFFGVIVIVAIAVVVAGIGYYAYTGLMKQPDTTTTPPVHEPEKTVLTIHLGSQVYDYTLTDLMALASISGQGGYINSAGVVTGPTTYTGVPVSVLLSTIPVLPDNFTFHAIASGGYTNEYSTDTVNGHVTVYNRAGEEIGSGTLTMIVAYMEDGVLLNETTHGPLRIAFVYSSPVITSAALWLSSLTDVDIL